MLRATLCRIDRMRRQHIYIFAQHINITSYRARQRTQRRDRAVTAV